MKSGKDSVKEVSNERWDIEQFYGMQEGKLNFLSTKWCATLDEAFDFDNQFFNMSPREALYMDPQQRLLLQESYHCIEDSGVNLDTLRRKRTAVYVAASAVDYIEQVYNQSIGIDSHSITGSYLSALSNRISFFYGFNGESFTIDAACASSIIAINQASEKLLAHKCDYALVGAVNLSLSDSRYISLSKARMLSEEGRCKAFSNDADGYVPGDGVGVILLRRLSDAEREQNHIYGVIKGGAANHVGRSKSITAPSMKAQRDCILEAWKSAGIEPKDISYIETHGTGTFLGDPIEAEALKRAFRVYTDKNGFCKIGSVKSNIGHLEPAAGMASVIKVLLMLKNQTIVKSNQITQLNSIINFEQSPLKVCEENCDWEEKGGIRLAGISSMGFTGANGHIVIEEYRKEKRSIRKENKLYPFMISAKNENSLKACIDKWDEYLKTNPECSVKDMCLTISMGREQFPYRIGGVIGSVEELDEIGKLGLSYQKEQEAYTVRIEEFEFNGYQEVQEYIDQNQFLRKYIQNTLRGLSSNVRNNFYQSTWEESYIRVCRYVATYVIATSFVKLGLNIGTLYTKENGVWTMLTMAGMVQMKEVIAFMLGEQTEIVLKRPTIPVYDGVRGETIPVIKITSEWVHDVRSMIYEKQGMEESEFQYLVEKSCVLYQKQFTYRQLLDGFKQNFEVKEYNLDFSFVSEKRESYESNLPDNVKKYFAVMILYCIDKLNKKWDLQEEWKAEYEWLIEIKQYLDSGLLTKKELPKLFLEKELQEEALAEAMNENVKQMPREELSNLGFGGEVLDQNVYSMDWIQNMRKANEEYASIHLQYEHQKETYITSLMQLWKQGISIHWEIYYENEGYEKLSLPTYQFNKTRFNLKDKILGVRKVKEAEKDIVQSNQAYFYQKEWKEEECIGNLSDKQKACVFVMQSEERVEIGDLSSLLHVNNVFTITQASEFRRIDQYTYEMDFGLEEHGLKMISALEELGVGIDVVLDLSDIQAKECASHHFAEGKMLLYQFLMKQASGKRLWLQHITCGLHPFENENPVLVGAEFASITKLVGGEAKHVFAKQIDIAVEDKNAETIRTIVQNELLNWDNQSEICYRNKKRYVSSMKPISQISVADRQPKTFQEHYPDCNAVVITGGTRGLGAEAAKYLAENGVKKILLVGKREIPERKEWERILEENTQQDRIETIQLVKWLEEKDVSVKLYFGSLADAESLTAYVDEVEEEWGPINGVIHCAGVVRNGNTAFVNKKLEDFRTVFEPKMDALFALDQVFCNRELQFFVLYSSVSAQLPSLTLGIVDYGAANSFMNYFAEGMSKKRSYTYQAINWPGWSGIGMKWNMSKAYHETGLKAQDRTEGIAMLDAVLGYKELPTILPCLQENEDCYRNWLNTKKEKDNILEFEMKQLESKKVEQTANTKEYLTELFSEILGMDKEEIDTDTNFGELGVDSIFLADIVSKLNKTVDESLDATILLEYDTITLLAEYIEQTYKEITLCKEIPIIMQEQNVKAQSISVQVPEEVDGMKNKIAIIGMGCHFPGAENVQVFWNNLRDGVDSVTEVPKNRFDIEPYYSTTYEKGKTISKWGGFIQDIEYFDPTYFELKEEDAINFDPLVRQFLEVSNETICDAGYSRKEIGNQKVGVFVGSRIAQYQSRIQEYTKNTVTGIGQNFIAAHIAHYFNLKGPALVVDTACSSSIVSVHMACKSILRNECDMAIAGGVDILLDEKIYLMLSEGRALSPDGKCHTFDIQANGFVPGEGAGAIMIKRLEDAIRDGDKIYAVIEGSAINNDGHTMGITTPDPEAQRKVIDEALQDAQVEASKVSYIEAHGTGTLIGDPIELKALNNVFRKYTSETQYCGLGSVKTNIGHLLSAAGIASIIKVALSIYNKQLPPTLNCNVPNVRFQFEQSPFYINHTLKEWTPIDNCRKAGISSFGFGGTNAHIILSDCEAKWLEHYNLSRKEIPVVQYSKKRFWLEPKKEHTKQQDVSKLLKLYRE